MNEMAMAESKPGLPKVAQRLDQLDEQVERLDHHTTLLIKRLAPALPPMRGSDEAVKAEMQPVGNQGEIALRLENTIAKLNEIVVAIIDTTSELEI